MVMIVLLFDSRDGTFLDESFPATKVAISFNPSNSLLS